MNKDFLKECLKFNHENVNHVYSTMTKYQEHGTKITENIFSLPFNKEMGTQGKEMLDQWNNFCKEGQENVKKMIDESFKNFEKILN